MPPEYASVKSSRVLSASWALSVSVAEDDEAELLMSEIELAPEAAPRSAPLTDQPVGEEPEASFTASLNVISIWLRDTTLAAETDGAV